jgi:aminomuconate-semialdehyde/2-hydroxymuconate-6-semialdehyde dehydrogenase
MSQDARVLDHFIDGAFCPSLSGRRFEDINPATQAVLAHVARGDAADVDRAVQAARQAFETGPWPKMSLKERCAILRRIGDGILARCDALAMAETLDTGKPITEALEGDIPRSAMNFHFFADYAPAMHEGCYTVDAWERHLAVREPLGVVGLITPWNLPLYLATWKIAPALAMGNTVVLKPAEWTPTTATLLGEIAQEAGLPPGVLNVVHGFGAQEAGEALTTHPAVSALSFTGETTTGKAIMRAAADTLKKVSFELGGKGATVIFDDADLSVAIPTAVRAAFRNQGQICLAGSRLFVHRRVLEPVMAEVTERVKNLRVGDPLDPATEMGAIISSEQLAKVLAYMELGQVEGRCLTGGGRVAARPEGNFLEPTVLADLPNASRVCQEEVFGPVLPIIPFETEEEVVQMVNSTPYGLSCSVWSQHVDRCHRVSQGIRTGLVWVNCWFARDLRTPFGGMKASGIGREGGQESLSFFSEAKTVCYRYQP